MSCTQVFCDYASGGLKGSYKSAKPSEEKQGAEKLRSCLPLFRMGLNTPALAELGDRWAGQRAWRTCSTYFPHTEPSLRFQHLLRDMPDTSWAGPLWPWRRKCLWLDCWTLCTLR